MTATTTMNSGISHRRAACRPPRGLAHLHGAVGGALLAVLASAMSSCGHSPTRLAPQAANGVTIAIVSARASPKCVEIGTKIINWGGTDVWIVLARGGPFVEPVVPRRGAPSSSADLRFSFSERVPASLPTHALPPRLMSIPSRGGIAMRIRVPLPIQEDPIYSAEYLGYGYPAPDWLQNVVRHEEPPFDVRVNVGVIARYVDTSLGASDEVWNVLSTVLAEQYIAETRSVKVSASAPLFDCFPGVSFLREERSS